jgi:hypothetical protein
MLLVHRQKKKGMSWHKIGSKSFGFVKGNRIKWSVEQNCGKISRHNKFTQEGKN